MIRAIGVTIECLIAFIAFCVIMVLLSGCSSLHYSVTPYGQVGREESGGKDWRAGVSVTLYDTTPAQAAVPSVHNTTNNTAVWLNNANSAQSNNSNTNENQNDNKSTGHPGHHNHGNGPKDKDKDKKGDD